MMQSTVSTHGVGVAVGVGSGVGAEHGRAQHGKYGGMQTHVPQQQLHSFPAGQLFAVGLHSFKVGIGAGVGVDGWTGTH